MKASELIAELQDIIKKHGDLKVTHSSFDDEEIGTVTAYDKDGDKKGEMVEIFLL